LGVAARSLPEGNVQEPTSVAKEQGRRRENDKIGCRVFSRPASAFVKIAPVPLPPLSRFRLELRSSLPAHNHIPGNAVAWRGGRRSTLGSNSFDPPAGHERREHRKSLSIVPAAAAQRPMQTTTKP
jgi:hypothetical protein